jgi:hypothetical protein
MKYETLVLANRSQQSVPRYGFTTAGPLGGGQAPITGVQLATTTAHRHTTVAETGELLFKLGVLALLVPPCSAATGKNKEFSVKTNATFNTMYIKQQTTLGIRCSSLLTDTQRVTSYILITI